VASGQGASQWVPKKDTKEYPGKTSLPGYSPQYKSQVRFLK